MFFYYFNYEIVPTNFNSFSNICSFLNLKKKFGFISCLKKIIIHLFIIEVNKPLIKNIYLLAIFYSCLFCCKYYLHFIYKIIIKKFHIFILDINLKPREVSQSIERYVCDFTPDERRILYDSAVKYTRPSNYKDVKNDLTG